ncbi:MAG: GNAT family N-acetyltransferase [Chloroflexia bacterium]|jgi:GNAT superfamily N-acetyltransferase|nr:GNAT family N-acetyltransferase [Chloroflexia bacterium]
MADPVFRAATEDDIAAIVEMLADDPLGATRETPDDLELYRDAFAAVDTNPNQLLIVIEVDGAVTGTAQMTFIAGLSHRGMRRADIEAVRIHAVQRGAGLGTLLIEWCIGQARERGCGIVQLTSHASRTDAHRFYERLGFTASHTGFKLRL